MSSLAETLVAAYNAGCPYRTGERHCDYVKVDDNEKELGVIEQSNLLAEMRKLIDESIQARGYDGSASLRYNSVYRAARWVYGWSITIELTPRGGHSKINNRPRWRNTKRHMADPWPIPKGKR